MFLTITLESIAYGSVAYALYRLACRYQGWWADHDERFLNAHCSPPDYINDELILECKADGADVVIYDCTVCGGYQVLDSESRAVLGGQHGPRCPAR